MTAIGEALVRALDRPGPVFSAAVVLASADGETAIREAAGRTRAWDRPGVPAADPWPAADEATVFDLASVTKLFTAAALLAELEAHGLDAELRAAELLPELGAGPAREIRLRNLLDHTAGFAAEWHDRERDASAWRRFRAGRPVDEPGTVHRYSCVGYIWAGLAAEALAGEGLAAVIARRVTGPLGLSRTGFLPGAEERAAIAATEFQERPPRGLVHGEVHDETAWALGGVAGNAGLFGPAGDLLRFAEMLRRGGELDGVRVLPEPAAAAMTVAHPVPGDGNGGPAFGQALGSRIGEEWMGALGGGRAAGHTGFTGTCLATEPGGSRSVVFLANRVHPARSSTELFSLRRTIADSVAKGLA